MSNFKTVKTTAFTSALFVGAMLVGSAASITPAKAMVVHNCTQSAMRIVLEPSNGGDKTFARVEAQSGQPISSPTSNGKYRIYVNTGAGNYFSGRSGNGTYSISHNASGNYVIQTGNKCPAPKPEPMPRPIPIDGGGVGGGTGGMLCATNKYGVTYCFSSN